MTGTETPMMANPDGTLRKSQYLFLNPYSDTAFTRCPRCEAATKVRKFPLVIHIDPEQLFLLNKSCRFCPACDLIIAKKAEVESLMAYAFEQRDPTPIGNDYLVVGTMDRRDWGKGVYGVLSQSETIERFTPFIDHINFEVIPGGWHPADAKVGV